MTEPRLPALTPPQLSPDQRDLYDAIAGGPRASGRQAFPLADPTGALVGPFNAMVHNPAVGRPLQELGAALRYRGSLPPRSREIAILVVAHAWSSRFEIFAHEAVGRSLGLEDAHLAALRAGDFAALRDSGERLVAETTQALARDGDLDDPRYAAARSGLGAAALVELTTLVGYYATLALQLRVFRVTTPDPA